MRELQQKQRFKRKIYSLPSLVILLILVGFSVRGTWEILDKKRESEQYVRELKAESEDLALRQKNLESDINYLETEEGIDEEIKERFNVSRAGEQVVIIVDPKPLPNSGEEKEKIWYKRMWNAIIDFL